MHGARGATWPTDDRCPVCAARMRGNDKESRYCDCGYSREGPHPSAVSLGVISTVDYVATRRYLDRLTGRLVIGAVIGNGADNDPARRWAHERRINYSGYTGGLSMVLQPASHVVVIGDPEARDLAASLGKRCKYVDVTPLQEREHWTGEED